MRKYIERYFRRSRAPQTASRALWSIGIFEGTSPLELGPRAGSPGAVVTRDHVTDVPASFVADPFLFSADGAWHLFFEVLNRRLVRGEIGLATSPDLATWKYERIVLAEPFHLSYPFVFEWEGARYMIPETHQTRTIRLYRADPFPTQWTLVHTLLSGLSFSDTTLFRHDDRWWLFTETGTPKKHGTLRLYFADDLFGVWTEHPASPIVEGDVHAARPAGSVVRHGASLLRFAQVCAPRYGTAVNAYEITELTPRTYAERPARSGVIVGGSAVPMAWNESRMHHVDAHEIEPGRWVAAVDGARNVTPSVIAGES
jgi:hypothetical protein